MPNLTRVTRYLPIPKARRLALKAHLVDRAFRRKIDVARTAKDSAAVEELQLQRNHEARMIREEMDHEYSDGLLRTARRFRLPVPRLLDEEGELMGDWTEGSGSGYVYLTETGITRVRD